MYVFKQFRRSLALVFVPVLMMVVLTACYSDYGMTTSDYDVVTTLYDNQYDFSTVKTYFMEDSIHHIIAEGEKDDISRAYDSYMLQQIAAQLQLRGIRRITDESQEKPDVAILLGVTTRENYVAYSNYYWGGYYGGYWGGYPGYGGYYPWYGGTTVYSYSTGSLIMNMVDPDLADDEAKLIPTVWIGAINGLLGDTATNTRIRLSNSISQAFIQSPYIGIAE